MKKILLTAAITAAALTAGTVKAAPAAPDVSGIYARSAAVVSVDYRTDVVTLEDANGISWRFTGCEDWNPGEVADLLLWDKGTPSILDDVILDARYSGYTTADFQ